MLNSDQRAHVSASLLQMDLDSLLESILSLKKETGNHECGMVVMRDGAESGLYLKGMYVIHRC